MSLWPHRPHSCENAWSSSQSVRPAQSLCISSNIPLYQKKALFSSLHSVFTAEGLFYSHSPSVSHVSVMRKSCLVSSGHAGIFFQTFGFNSGTYIYTSCLDKIIIYVLHLFSSKGITFVCPSCHCCFLLFLFFIFISFSSSPPLLSLFIWCILFKP